MTEEAVGVVASGLCSAVRSDSELRGESGGALQIQTQNASGSHSQAGLAERDEAGRLQQQIRGTEQSLEHQAGGSWSLSPRTKGNKVSEEGVTSKEHLQKMSPLRRHWIDW